MQGNNGSFAVMPAAGGPGLLEMPTALLSK